VRFPAGGKTGTTNEFKDAWFVGFSSSVVAAVWVGFDQPATIGREAYGARLALPIWAEFMKRAHQYPYYKRATSFSAPEGVVSVEIDPSGVVTVPTAAAAGGD